MSLLSTFNAKYGLSELASFIKRTNLSLKLQYLASSLTLIYSVTIVALLAKLHPFSLSEKLTFCITS